jgi:hypothetical protein
MISVQRVYEVVRDLCNKDQQGFISPNVFNTLARVAQQNIFNEMFTELKLATALRASGRDGGRDKSAYKMVEEDLSTFIRTININEGGTINEDLLVNSDEDSFVFRRPADFARLISMNVLDSNTSVEIIHDNEKATRVLNSNLSAPTIDFPIALEMTDVFQVFPDDTDGVSMRYYRQPRARNFNSGLLEDSFPQFIPLQTPGADNLLIVDTFQSMNFDLPEHYINEVVSEVLKMIGVRLRDNALATYGVQQTTAE